MTEEERRIILAWMKKLRHATVGESTRTNTTGYELLELEVKLWSEGHRS